MAAGDPLDQNASGRIRWVGMDCSHPLGFDSIGPHLANQIGDSFGWKDDKKTPAGAEHPACSRRDVLQGHFNFMSGQGPLVIGVDPSGPEPAERGVTNNDVYRPVALFLGNGRNVPLQYPNSITHLVFDHIFPGQPGQGRLNLNPEQLKVRIPIRQNQRNHPTPTSQIDEAIPSFGSNISCQQNRVDRKTVTGFMLVNRQASI